MKAPLARIAYIIAVVAVASYALVALRGPGGISAWLEKERQIKVMEKRNAELSKEVERARSRIERLKSDPAEQERVIKERLKLVHPGEKIYILGESDIQKK
jgi:cell division protein FtsB